MHLRLITAGLFATAALAGCASAPGASSSAVMNGQAAARVPGADYSTATKAPGAV